MDALVESKRMYYESLGIKLLTYCQDEEGYERQYKIIKGWIDQLSEETFYESDIFNSIKVCLEEYNKDNYEYILHVLCELDSDDKSYLDFVLENIPLSKDNYIYFEKLWHDGIISVNDCPKVVNSQDGYGYTAPYWKATDCMFHIISGSVQNIYIQNLAVEFMNKVIDKINADEEILKNFHLRYTVISIVLLLDSDHINQQCIDFLCRTYKFESFDTIGSEIMRSRPDWLKWDEDKINQMFEFIFGCESLNNKTFSNLHSYNLSKIYTKIKSILTEIQKAFIVKLCITNMIKSFENIRYQYFDSFETQLQDLEFEYEKVLDTIIQDLLEFIDNEMIESIVSDSSRKINIQFALYLCKLMNMNITILNKFNINPLDIEGTIADFYCYLDAYQSCFSDNEAKNIIHLESVRKSL